MDRRAPLAVVRAFTRGGIFNMLTLGFQETDLTSASPMQRIRFAQSGLSQGVDRPLWAQVSLWQLEEARCALVAIDHIGFGLERGASLRARLAALLRCSPEQVMLCFSHTHAAPNDSLEADDAAWADERIVSAASEALQNMRPVRIAWGLRRGGY